MTSCPARAGENSSIPAPLFRFSSLLLAAGGGEAGFWGCIGQFEFPLSHVHVFFSSRIYNNTLCKARRSGLSIRKVSVKSEVLQKRRYNSTDTITKLHKKMTGSGGDNLASK